MAKDISAVGAKIQFTGGVLDKLVISEFSDEGTPFDCPDVDVSTNAKNLNGEMISSRTPSVIPFSITVLPGSLADYKLGVALRKAMIIPGNSDQSESVEWYGVTVSIPRIAEYNSAVADASGDLSACKQYTFSSVRIKSGPTSPSTSAEGRLSARTYSFEAETVSEGKV